MLRGEHEPNKEEILSPQAAWLTTSALIGYSSHRITALRIGRTVAVKTAPANMRMMPGWQLIHHNM